MLRECLLGTKSLYVSFFEFLFVIVVTVQPLKSNGRGAPVKEVNRRTLQNNLGERQTSKHLLEFKRVTIIKGCE